MTKTRHLPCFLFSGPWSAVQFPVRVFLLKFPSSFDGGVDICKPAEGEGLAVELAGCHPALGGFVPPIGGGDGPEGSGRAVG